MEKIFLVKYYGGSHEDYYEEIVFATPEKQMAIEYISKFNAILKKWKDHFKQYEETKGLFKHVVLKEEFKYIHHERWSRLNSIDGCSFEEVKVRRGKECTHDWKHKHTNWWQCKKCSLIETR